MTIKDVVDWLASLPSDDDRVEALSAIHNEICHHCGKYYPGRDNECACWNDD